MGSYNIRVGMDYRAMAKALRKKQTAAEAVLWERVRARRLGGFKFRRQHVLRDKIVDFYCREAYLIIELDGGVHDNPEQQAKDLDRDAQFAIVGYRTLRFRNVEVLHNSDAVCSRILDVIYERLEQQR